MHEEEVEYTYDPGAPTGNRADGASGEEGAHKGRPYGGRGRDEADTARVYAAPLRGVQTGDIGDTKPGTWVTLTWADG